MRTTTSAHVARQGRTPDAHLSDVLARVHATGAEVIDASVRPLAHDDAKHFVSVTWDGHLDFVAVAEAVAGVWPGGLVNA